MSNTDESVLETSTLVQPIWILFDMLRYSVKYEDENNSENLRLITEAIARICRVVREKEAGGAIRLFFQLHYAVNSASAPWWIDSAD